MKLWYAILGPRGIPAAATTTIEAAVRSLVGAEHGRGDGAPLGNGRRRS
jgi:hypothetical protein